MYDCDILIKKILIDCFINQLSKIHSFLYWVDLNIIIDFKSPLTIDNPMENSDLVKFVMCALVSRVHMMFYTLRKGYTVPGNQGIHDKLNQIH